MPRERYSFDRDGNLVERRTGEALVTPDRIATPRVMRDLEYKSPLSFKPVTSRSQRRDEMARYGVREVDPSEYKPTYNTRKFAERSRQMGGKGDHEPRTDQPLNDGSYKRLSREEVPEKIRRTIERPNT